MDDICDEVKTLMKPGAHGHVVFCALQSSQWRHRSVFLTEEKKGASDGKFKEV